MTWSDCRRNLGAAGWRGISQGRKTCTLPLPLSENGIFFDRKKFSPHITLIRKVSFRGGVPKEVSENINVRETMAEAVSLMHSERGRKGMIYTEIGEIDGD